MVQVESINSKATQGKTEKEGCRPSLPCRVVAPSLHQEFPGGYVCVHMYTRKKGREGGGREGGESVKITP